MRRLFPEIPRLRGERILMRGLTEDDAEGLRALTTQAAVYRYLPAFLIERKYGDPREAIRRMYGEYMDESLILGVFLEGQFCGLAEMYGYREPIHKISVGHRFMQEQWGKGLSSEALRLMIRFLTVEKGIGIITASSTVENRASAHVLEKNGFERVAHAVEEDWGYEDSTLVDKWIR